MLTNCIPRTLKPRVSRAGMGGVVSQAPSPVPALYRGAKRIAEFPQSKEVTLDLETFASREFLDEHDKLAKEILIDLRQADIKEKLPTPPVKEPILVRRSMVAPERLFLEEAYDKVIWVNRCVNVIAQTIADVPLRVMRRQKDGSPAQPDTESSAARKLLRIIERPNAHQSGRDLIQAMSTWMNVRQCLLWMMGPDEERTKPEYFKKNLPVALYCLPAQWSILMLEGATPLYYRQSRSGKNIPAWQVIRLGFYNPKEELRCLSPLSALFQSADMDYATDLFNAEFFEQGLKPSGLITIKGEANEQKETKYKTLVSQMAGLGNAHGYLFMDDDAKFTPMVQGTKDMDFKNLADLNRQKMCMGFGVPRIILGDPENSNKASADVGRRVFWQNTALPQMGMIEDKLNVSLAPCAGDPDLFYQFDVSAVEALADDRSEFAQSFFQAAQGLSYLNQVLPLTPEDIQQLLEGHFGITVEGQEPDDSYEDEEEIMEESAKIPELRQLKNITLGYLRMGVGVRAKNNLKLMCLKYLLSPRRTRKPTAEIAGKLADQIVEVVRGAKGNPDIVARYFDALERKVGK